MRSAAASRDAGPTAIASTHLGLGVVIDALRERLSSPWVRTHAGGPYAGFDPSAVPAQVRSRLDEIDALHRRLEVLAGAGGESGEGRPGGAAGWMTAALRDVVDIGDPLDRAARGAVLEAAELAEVGAVASALCTLARLIAPADAAATVDEVGADALAQALRGLDPDPELAARLQRSVDRDADPIALADAASKALAAARAEARGARKDLIAAAQRLIARPDVADALADSFWTERAGRVVLPVKAGSLSRGRGGGVGGIIHGSSTSGQTFFVEPHALIEDNNRVRQAQAHARAQERRVLAELSALVGAQAAALRAGMDAAARLDRITARASLGVRLGGVRPAVLDPHRDDAGALDLPAARHPAMVLADAHVVPNDLSLPIGSALLVSGPNAGGKTVALKTIGLCVLMAQLGVWVPCAAPAHVPLFASVVTDVGDDQSIAANLSTFTAHLGHVQRALDAAAADGRATLVLLDEVAVGTDPEQGAALAEAIVCALVERGATVVATTHYERLKLLAARESSDAFRNAAVGFDLANLRPTFTLQTGLPGSSSALAVAQRLGLDDSVLRHAEGLLDDRRVAVDSLLAQLEAQRVALAETQSALDDERAAVAQQRQRLAAGHADEETSAAKGRAAAHRQAQGALAELHTEIERRRRRLRAAPLQSAPDGQAPPPDADARAFAQAARTQLQQRGPQRPPAEGAPPATAQVGDRVWVASLDAAGEVVAIKGERVTVQLATLKTTVKLADVRARTSGKRSARTAPAPAPRPSPNVGRHFGADAKPFDPGLDDVVDLRGCRADEAVAMMEVSLDRALADDRDVVVLKHGHGSGALRKAVRDALPRLRHVAAHRGGLSVEGGDAVTVVWVKG